MSYLSMVDLMISHSAVPPLPVLKDMHDTLYDIHMRHVALKKNDCQLQYKVFTEVLGRLNELMKQVDPYYARYSWPTNSANCQYDELRINTPSEYVLTVGINLPGSMEPVEGGRNSFLIKPVHPGYVQLRGTEQYLKVFEGDEADCRINRAAHSWMYDRNYVQPSEFMKWFKDVVTNALLKLPRKSNRASLDIGGIVYTIRHTEDDLLCTLIIENEAGFKLEVELVPALIFPESRWPVDGHRPIPPHCNNKFWVVVPKSKKYGSALKDKNRSWRICLQEQERKTIYNSYYLQLTENLLKKFCATQGMTHIKDYYITTLCLLEIHERPDPGMWFRHNFVTLFTHMVQRLYDALNRGNVSYFWNKKYNLIDHVSRKDLDGYANAVEKLIRAMKQPTGHKLMAKYLLTDAEYGAYQKLFLRQNMKK